MITSGLLDLGYLIIGFITGHLPVYTGLPSGFTTWLSSLGSGVGSLSCVEPLSAMRTQLTIIFYTAGALAVFNFFAWLFRWRKH